MLTAAPHGLTGQRKSYSLQDWRAIHDIRDWCASFTLGVLLRYLA